MVQRITTKFGITTHYDPLKTSDEQNSVGVGVPFFMGVAGSTLNTVA